MINKGDFYSDSESFESMSIPISFKLETIDEFIVLVPCIPNKSNRVLSSNFEDSIMSMSRIYQMKTLELRNKHLTQYLQKTTY